MRAPLIPMRLRTSVPLTPYAWGSRLDRDGILVDTACREAFRHCTEVYGGVVGEQAAMAAVMALHYTRYSFRARSMPGPTRYLSARPAADLVLHHIGMQAGRQMGRDEIIYRELTIGSHFRRLLHHHGRSEYEVLGCERP